MRHGSLFSGIGGFDLASEWMGWENVFHCEWNEFGQKVLKYYWPKAISYNDITKTDFSVHRGTIDIITGGFPCQPYSMAGKRLGKEDERHLWPEMLRAIREIRPTWVVGENVFGLVNWNGGMVFEEVQTDLEAEGYEVQAFVLPAASVNAPHKRERIWIVAYAKPCSDSGNSREVSTEAKEENGRRIESSTSSKQQIQLPTEPSTLFGNNSNSESWREGGLSNESQKTGTRESNKSLGGLCGLSRSDYTNSTGIGLQRWSNGGILRSQRERGKQRFKNLGSISRTNWDNFPTSAPICSGNDGISDRLDSITFSKWRNESIKAGGNAIVPQVVHQIFKAIEQYETTRYTQGT